MIHFPTRSGVRLAADAAGPEDGPFVLFLHGGGQTRHSWGTALSAAADRGFRAIGLDLRGHGDSDWAADGDYRIATHVADVGDVLAQLARPAALVGASLGGLTALMATGDGLPVWALVLVDVVPRIEMEGAQEIQAFMTGNPDGFATLDDAADAIASYLPHRPRPSNTAGLRKNLRQRDNGRYYWHWDPALLSGRERLDPASEGREAELLAAAGNIHVPTLLVRGGRSRVVSMEGVAAFQQAMPHSEFVNIDHADHMVAGDDNDAFNAPLLDFLDRSR